MKKLLSLFIILLTLNTSVYPAAFYNIDMNADHNTNVANSTIKGSFNDKKYAVKVFKAAMDYQDKYCHDKFPTYKDVAKAHGVKAEDLKDLNIAYMIEGDIGGMDDVINKTNIVDGNRYTEMRFRRIVDGDFIDNIYKEIYNYLKNGLWDKPKDFDDFLNRYPGASDIIAYYEYQGIDQTDIRLQRDVFVEILRQDYKNGKTTLKTSDPTTAKAFVRAAVLCFKLESFLEFSRIEQLVKVFYMDLNREIYNTITDKTNDKKGTLTQLELYKIFWTYEKSMGKSSVLFSGYFKKKF